MLSAVKKIEQDLLHETHNNKGFMICTYFVYGIYGWNKFHKTILV